jgi:phosphate transport system protein
MVNDVLVKKLISLGVLVSKTLNLAIQSFEKRNIELAEKIEKDDDKVNVMSIEIEEECLKVLALNHLVANDLRFVIMALKINKNLERIADIAVNIAKNCKYFSPIENFVMPIEFHELSKAVEKMLDSSVTCLVRMDINSAKRICLSDDRVDQIHKQSYVSVKKAILLDLANYDNYNACLAVSKHLESIGDLSTNIAEDICYMVVGKIIRHKNRAELMVCA